MHLTTQMHLMIVISLVPLCKGIEPVSTLISVGSAISISVGFAAYEYGKCKLKECCADPWVKFDPIGLKNSLENSLHGQPLAVEIITRSVQKHISKKQRKKALVMAFQGWTGSGKNFAANLIAKNLYAKGLESKYVHLYIAPLHFPHANKVSEYKEKLQKEILEHTKSCSQSLFIFDEVDKMPSGVLDVLKPYVDFYNDIDGVDYRKNIFIFLSNAGGDEITKVTFDFWLADKGRDTIRLKDIESLINKGAFNEKGGLQHSTIIKHHLIDIYVPFLPLEKQHVKLCIRDEINARDTHASEDMIEEIANQLDYRPPEFLLYSSSGCKLITRKVDLYLDD